MKKISALCLWFSMLSWQVAFAQPCTNYALSFSGGNWVEIADHPSLRPCPTCPFTIEVWVRRESGNALQHILGKRTGCNNPSDFYQMCFDPYLNWGNTTRGSAYSNIYLPINEWHHMAGVFNAGQFMFYYDGVLVGCGMGTIGDGMGVSLKFATSGSCPFSQYLIGKMDNVRIWNAARTQEEIQADMFGCITGSEPGLAGAWNFDEGNGGITYDLTANNNDGTLINNPAWVISTLPCFGEPTPDMDGDGVNHEDDNCPLTANSNQADADNDGLGNACDPYPNDPGNDADNDGLNNFCDPCPNDPGNDTDNDGICDNVDPCPNSPGNDADNDGICDDLDPCPNDHSNDTDGDGICFNVDNCPFEANADQADVDNDGLGDACDICPNSPNRALSLNGNNWVEIPDDPSLTPCPTCPFTIELWVYRESDNSLQHIVGKRIGCGGGNFYQIVFDPYLNFVSPGLGTVYTNIDLPRFEWHHVATVFNGSHFGFYYDGVLIATGSGMIGGGAGTSLILGGSGDCYGEYFGGKMDNVRIWNVARTAEEIQDDMTRCLTGAESGLAGAWNFDEGNGNITYDLSPNHNDGILMNNPTWSFSPLPCCSESSFEVDAGDCEVVHYGYAPEACQTLVATPMNGDPPYSYYWNNGATASSITVCPNQTTTFTITVTDANNQSAVDDITVNVIDVRCGNNNSKVLVCHIPPGNPSNPQVICISPSAVPAHLAHGCYVGICGAPDPCESENQNIITNHVDPVSNDSGNALNKPAMNKNHGEEVLFMVMPNPADEEIEIQTNFSPAVINIIDLSGHVVIQQVLSGQKNNIRIGSLPDGMYFIRLKNGMDAYLKSIVIIH